MDSIIKTETEGKNNVILTTSLDKYAFLFDRASSFANGFIWFRERYYFSFNGLLMTPKYNWCNNIYNKNTIIQLFNLFDLFKFKANIETEKKRDGEFIFLF